MEILYGQKVWAAKSLNNTIVRPIGKFMVVDDNNFLYLTGTFGGTVDFDPNISVYNVTSTNIIDSSAARRLLC